VSFDPPGCPGFSAELALFIDGELGAVERASAEAHLSSCAACREAAAFRDALRARLRRAEAEHPAAAAPAPNALRARLRAALDVEDALAAPVRATRRFSRPWGRPMAAAGAGATALGLTAWLWMGTGTDEVVRDIVVRHTRHLPLEFQGNDPHSLERWLSDKVQFRVQVPKLKGGPYNLVGARLSHVKDHDAVYMVFGSEQRPDHRLAMFVYDDSTGRRVALPAGPGAAPPDDVYVANSAGYNVAVWKQNEVVYSLVSDGDDDVLELVRAARGR
jgi:anti-sigma factor RsiW